MIFGKHINRYYLKYAGWLVLGLAALVMVDYFQLEIPKLYRLVINGMNGSNVGADGVSAVGQRADGFPETERGKRSGQH